MLWTGLLAANQVGAAEAVLPFGVYVLPFLLDELIAFAVAVVTLRATKMQDRRRSRRRQLVASAMP